MPINENIKNYLRESLFPSIWCSGCGHGIVVQACLRAINKMKLHKDDIMVVAGIGCTSRVPAYLDFNTVQTTHGRAIPFATGMKMHRPDMNIILFLGDGDCASIGGNHLIHAARRNIDITVIVLNNYVFGMTGGQSSPTMPYKAFSTTAPYGNIEPQLDVCKIAIAAGATFVARSTAYHVIQLSSLIEQGIKNKGFSLIECIEPCIIGYAKKNKIDNPITVYKDLKNSSIPVEKVKGISYPELEEKIVIGVLSKENKPEFVDSYLKVVKKVKAKTDIREKYLRSLPALEQKLEMNRIKILLSGSGGQGLILAGIIFGEAAVMNGRNVVHSQSYGTEARGGASRSELIISDKDIEIDFSEDIVPHFLLAMSQQSSDKFAHKIPPEGVVIIDSTQVLKKPETKARVYQYPITKIAVEEFNNKMVANTIALGVLGQITGLVSKEAISEAVENRVPENYKELNIRALQRGFSLYEGRLVDNTATI